MQQQAARDAPFFSSEDLRLFLNGKHSHLFELLGAQPIAPDCKATRFVVWAPRAQGVAVVGGWNQWQAESNPLELYSDGSGIWLGVFQNIPMGVPYRYRIVSGSNYFEKCDPFASQWQKSPAACSLVWNLQYRWQDQEWMQQRHERNARIGPWAIYQVHLPSWKRIPEQNNHVLDYEQLANQLAEYAHHMNYTHVELLPIMEDAPYDITGAESVGFFAPSARHGTSQQCMNFIEILHKAGIGVVLNCDFISFDNYHYGLANFDGAPLYEYASLDGSYFDFTRGEVRSFLRSAAFFWIEKYHIDGIKFIGLEKLAQGAAAGLVEPARQFFKELAADIRVSYPDVRIIYDLSSVGESMEIEQVNFDFTTDLQWGERLLAYAAHDPLMRKAHHQELVACGNAAANVIRGYANKQMGSEDGSILSRLPGDDWQKLANLRLLFAFLYAMPGKKMLFMGTDFGQWQKWNPSQSIDWHLLDAPAHQQLLRWVKDLNHFYKNEPVLHDFVLADTDTNDFQWLEHHDSEHSVVSFIRTGATRAEELIAIFNFTPVPRHNYMLGVPAGGWWQELLNSDAALYGGAGYGNLGGVEAAPIAHHGKYYALNLILPPLAALFLKKPLIK